MTTNSTEVPKDETPEDDDQQEHGSRLSEDRDAPDAAGPDDDQAGDAGEADQDDDQDDDQDGDTFPRPYVERLRSRSAGYRARAKTAEDRVGELEQSLFTERVRALDVLADPTDLPFNADALEDPDALRAAVDDLVSKRPHLRRRGVARDTGSREGNDAGDTVSLVGLMRGGA